MKHKKFPATLGTGSMKCPMRGLFVSAIRGDPPSLASCIQALREHSKVRGSHGSKTQHGNR